MYVSRVAEGLPLHSVSADVAREPKLRFSALALQGSTASSENTRNLPDRPMTSLTVVGSFTLAVSAIMGALLLVSPVLPKKANAVTAWVEKLLKAFKVLRPDGKLKKLEAVLSDREAFQTFSKKMSYAIGLFGTATIFQNAISNKQPTMFSSGLFQILNQVLGIRFPDNNYIWSLSSIRASLFNAGKHTELENYKHPERRQEWDIKRLNPFADREGKRSYGQDVSSFVRFLGEDIRYSFSKVPWKALKKDLHDKDVWKSPQPHISSITSALNMLTFILTTSGLLMKKNWLTMLSLPVMLVANTLWNQVITARAWENKKDLDGRLVLAGMPLSMIGMLFQPTITARFFFLSGIASIGNSLTAWGVMLNSRKHECLVDTLKQFYATSLHNPNFSARQLLDQFQHNPLEAKRLQKAMGTNRFAFLMTTLQNADIASRQKNIPFSEFLAPIAKSHSRHV